MKTTDVLEMSVASLLAALDAGDVTSVDLVCAYLNRIAYYDRTGIALSAVPVLNPGCLDDAAASDERRRKGKAGQLEGIPFTVKDSYKVKGMTVAAGSPALAELVATEDAATVALLRDAGAVLIGKTNMPPMAAGGIQPGVYGYARSPYNPQYLTAAYGSGSSNGSGTATAASLCGFGMAEETVSSGRSPASNNGLVAYTPSRGVLSIRGNWPLRPTCDVVVPHTRTVDDLMIVLDVIAVDDLCAQCLMILLDVLAVDDPVRTGDFWREQRAVELPSPDSVFQRPIARERSPRLDGIRIGVPRMYIGEDLEMTDPPVIRPSVRTLWDRAADDLQALGAEIIEVDFPVISNYEQDRPGAIGLGERGLVPASWRALEGGTITAMALDAFLRDNADPLLSSWADVDGDTVFPIENAPVPVWITRARGGFDWQRLAELVKQGLPSTYSDVPELDHLLRGLEEARRVDLEEWLDASRLDLVVFPAAGDIGMDDLFTWPESLEAASRNGVVYSNGNRAIRHLGIPTVTVPMGFMSDTQMPVGLTFAGAAYSDDRLIDCAWAYENATHRRAPAFLTPSLPSNQIERAEHGDGAAASAYEVTVSRGVRAWQIEVHLQQPDSASVWADGHQLQRSVEDPRTYRGSISLARRRLTAEIFVLVKAGGAATMTMVALPA